MKSVIGLIIFVLSTSLTHAGPPAPPMIRPPMVPPTGMPMIGQSKGKGGKDLPLGEAKNIEGIVELMKARQENSSLTTKPEEVKDLVIVESIILVVLGSIIVSLVLIFLFVLS